MNRFLYVIFACAALLTACISLSGCGKEKSTVTGVSMKAQDYTNGSIYELPCFIGEGPAVEQLNEAIDQQRFYYIQGWEAMQSDSPWWYEVRSYPICGQRYKQVVITAIELPNYGTDGDVYSFCYDSQTGAILTLDDALAQTGVSRETVQSMITYHIGDHLYEGDSVTFVSCEAFAFAGNELCIVARALIENDLSDGRDELFVYFVGQDAIYSYDHGDLFPAGLCDQLEPPLSYAD